MRGSRGHTERPQHNHRTIHAYLAHHAPKVPFPAIRKASDTSVVATIMHYREVICLSKGFNPDSYVAEARVEIYVAEARVCEYVAQTAPKVG
jgi:hypothetical protein